MVTSNIYKTLLIGHLIDMNKNLLIDIIFFIL